MIPERAPRRALALATAAALLGLTLAACAQPPLSPPPPAPDSSPSAVSAISLRLFLEQPETIVGGGLPATIVLTHTGPAALRVPDPQEEMPFIFAFRRQKDGPVVATWSYQRKAETLSGERAPTRALLEVELPPGQEARYTIDLARLASEPLPAGRYLVSALYRHGGSVLASDSVAVAFRSLQPTSWRCVGDDDKLAVAATQPSGEGRTLVLAREGRSGRPELGGWQTLGSSALEDPQPTPAIDGTEGRPGWRWFAWLDRGQATAAVVWSGQKHLQASPVDLALSQPRLLAPGWQTQAGDGLFYIQGRLPSGPPAVQRLRFARAESAADQPWACPADALGDPQLSYGPTGEPQLLWAEARNRGFALLARPVATPSALPRELLSTTGRLLAWQAAVRYESGAPAIALLVAREREGQPTWLRLAWSPEAPELAEQPIDAPSTPAALADAAWSVSAQSRPPASALAASSSSLQLWTAGSGWHTLASGAPTRFAALVPALDGATPVTWVLWLAPDGSLRAHRAP